MYYAYGTWTVRLIRDTCITKNDGGAMADESVDRELVQRIQAKLARILCKYPELQEHNPERQQALEEWLEALERGGEEDGV